MSVPSLVLIDTSAWIDVLRDGGDAAVRGAVTSALSENRAAMAAPVWVELYGGVRGKKELEQLAALRRLCHWLDIDDECWNRAAETARACREKGVTVPLGDVLVFGCAQRHGIGILEKDKHFVMIAKAVGG
jgi:predicted nucleic acid-binding protein